MKTPSFMRLRARRNSAGVALVTAIFLLVVLAGLAVAVVSLTSTQQAASIQDIQGQRAYQAARAGTEWALYIALRSGPAAPTPNATLACGGGPYAVAMPANTTLSGFTVTVTCAGTADHIVITSTACNQPGANGCPNVTRGAEYVQRVLTVQL